MALTLAATPAIADVKAGVDAWQRGDYATAVEEWRPLALAGDPDAQFNLGQAYKLGRGVDTDPKQAESWYRKAALQGHRQAEDNYGLALFQNGSHRESVAWLERSAARGEARAQYVLATLLFNGEFAQKDWVRAYALMTRASLAGLAQASQSLAQMDRYVEVADRQKGAALARELELTATRPADPPARAQPPAVPPMQSPPVEIAAAPQPVDPAPVRAADPEEAAAEPPPDGAWRVQLGAFRKEGRAEALWTKLQGGNATLTGLQPYIVKSGTLTLLLAGPLANKREADRICAALKSTRQPCLATRS